MGSFERDQLKEFLQDTQDDALLVGAVDFGKAALMPAALIAGAYVAYMGLINFGTGVDGLRQRFDEMPFGRYTDQFGRNFRRTNPVYRFLTWGFGGENPPIIPPQTTDKAQSIIEKAVDVITGVIPDVPNVGGSGTDPTPPASNAGGGGGGF